MKQLISIILFISLCISVYSQSRNVTISGYVREQGSDELLIGVNIYLKGTQIGTVTNNYGFYSLTILPQQAELIYSYVGYESQSINSNLDSSFVSNIFLKSSTELSEVKVHGECDRIADRVEMSVVSIPVKQIRDIPSILGEKDVFKVLQLMPGVRGASEGSSGLYVRGGSSDQNLVILDDAPVYNAMHLFGFFSVFNGDAIKSVDLYKGGFPARYGGRISSVIDLSLKDGNRTKFGGEGSVGILSSRLLLEGPIVKKKSSFIISARRTYADLFVRPVIAIKNKGTKTGYYFYDVNAKVNYDISDKDKLFLSGYFGRDKFISEFKNDSYKSKNNLFWENATATFRWNHQFSNKLFSNTSLIYSNYYLKVDVRNEDEDDSYILNSKSGIRDFGLKSDLSWLPNNRHYVRFGGALTNHLFTPSAVVIKINNLGTDYNVKELNSIESALYVEDEWKAFNRFKVNLGLRFSNFNYNDKSYFGLEPRILANYMLTDLLSVKASYVKMTQYVHLLTSSGLGLPTDLWVPATDRVGPQKSQQFALGIAKDVENPDFTVSVEAYYKTMNDIISYKEGSSFLMIGDLRSTKELDYEDNVTVGNGWSTGLEFLIQRKFGKLSGWIGYTLSYTKYQFDELNFGEEFFPRHDRRHDISIVGMYKLNDKITLSATWVYGTGDAITLSSGSHIAFTHEDNTNINMASDNILNDFGSIPINYYDSKNSYRMAAYHRLDFGVQFSKKLKKGRERIIEVSLYNAYNRKNPFYYAEGWSDDMNSRELKQISLFPILPGFSYYLKF